MKLSSSSLLSAAAIVLGVAVGALATGCPAPTCPQCSIKKAQFTIPPAEGEIIDVVMFTTVEFTDHCDGEKAEGCNKSEEESLGVLPESVRQAPKLPFTTDDNDTIDVRIEVHRQTPSGIVIQTPAPAVMIVR